MQNTMLDSVVSSPSQELSDASASSAIKLFENPLFKARVIMRCAEPWFVAKDVATCIEHSDTSAMCKLCRDKDKVVVRANDLTSDDLSDVKNREYTLISESGLYRILAKCNLPKCEPFESWVFDEVLPSIRKTGSYSVAQPQPQQALGVINESLRTQQTFSKNAPHITLISEYGLYRILAKCNLPKCEPFENWVFDEVLPSIRKIRFGRKWKTFQTKLTTNDLLVVEALR